MLKTSLSTVKQFPKKHPGFTEGGLRDQIFHADENGLEESGAIIRNGRRVLIDEKRYFSWLAKKNGRPADWFDELTRECPECGNPLASFPDCEDCGHMFDGSEK